MADGFDTVPCEPNQSDCQKVSQYTFDTQVGSAYNVSRAIAEQWQVIEQLKQDVGEVADKTAVKDYNGNIFDNLTLKGENGINIDISEDDPEQLNISIDRDITDQIEINMENIISLENTTDGLDTRVTQTETSITEITPDVARALKTPMAAPTETKLVAVDTTNSQEMINIGETLTTVNNTLNVDLNKSFVHIDKLYEYQGYTSGNYTLYEGKSFPDYKYIIFVFRNTLSNEWITEEYPIPVFLAPGRNFICSRYSDGENRYIKFQYVNANTFYIGDNHFMETMEIWGIR